MKTKLTVVILLALAFAAPFFTSCHHNSQTKAADTYEYTDDYNNTVSVPSPPRRIVSLSPAVTEIIFALGRGDLLVGRTDFCQYPPEAAQIESVGGISNLNVEKILALNPDLVISGSMIPQKSAEHLMSLGVPLVCVIEKNRFDGLYENISKIGQLTDRTQTAYRLIDSLKHVMDADQATYAQQSDSNRPSVYYVVGFGAGGNFTAGGDTFINDLIAMAGGRNIAAGVKGWSYSLEALMDENPDYIIIRREDSALFCNTKPYTRLDAVKQGRVVAIESATIDLQIPRNIDCVRTLRQSFANHK
ncbi:MAG: ABC transporter substrate-binding protein [Bacteroidales bacterium]|nr:ABC transporter substrate-binding protein [Bacteroidales bacterium]